MGCADFANLDGHHPGAVGICPEIRLAGGVVTLRRTQGAETETNPHYEMWGPPMGEVSIPVGPCPEQVLNDGDVLTVSRWGAADVALIVRRRGALVAALGAVAHAACGPEVQIEEDPRALDARWYEVKNDMARPDTSLVLLDASVPDSTSQLQRVREARAVATRVLIAIHGGDPERRRALNHQAAQSRFDSGRGSAHYFNIDERFKTADEWLAYVQALPDRRPYDLWIRFTTPEGSAEVREDRYELLPPWHLFVQKVYRWGIPGELSQLAIVREQEGVTKESVIRSSEIIARRDVTFDR